jgi:hypothetical protein
MYALPLLLAVALPWTASLRGRVPSIDLAIQENANYGFLLVGLIAMALLSWDESPWLCALSVYLTLRAIWTPTPFAFETAQAVAIGTLLLFLARRFPVSWSKPAGHLIAVTVVLQVAYAVLQKQGYSPLWIGWNKIPGAVTWVHGTLGNPNHLGAFLAIAAPLAPLWSLPAFGLGLILSGSALAGVATAVAFSVRFRARWKLIIPAILGFLLLIFLSRGLNLTSWADRAVIWRVAAQATTYRPVTGFGPGSWQTIGPALQRTPEVSRLLHTPEPWQQVHNEWIQLGFEGGVIALVLAGGWVWSIRHVFTQGRYGEALLAAFVVSLGSFPLHVATLSALVITVAGFAIADQSTRSRGDRLCWNANDPSGRTYR